MKKKEGQEPTSGTSRIGTSLVRTLYLVRNQLTMLFGQRISTTGTLTFGFNKMVLQEAPHDVERSGIHMKGPAQRGRRRHETIHGIM